MLTSIMNTNSKVKESKPFPKLMISNTPSKFIILADSLTDSNLIGTVIQSNDSSYSLGYFSRRWEPCSFRDWEGSVTLTQE